MLQWSWLGSIQAYQINTLHALNVHNIIQQLSEKQWHPAPVLLPGKSHGRRSLVGCGPWGRSESGTTEWLHFHFSLSCIGEGNGNPLQCSCLENPRDGGAWWAAVYGVAQSRTRLKWLSSSIQKLYWVGQKVCLGFCTILWKKLNKQTFGQQNISTKLKKQVFFLKE